MALSVPSDHTRGGEVLKGVKSWSELDQFALFDRIINIKFIRRHGDSFCIRSDYEVAYSADGKPYFRNIAQKPHIVVSYKQVSNDVAVSVDIRITNLAALNAGQNEEQILNLDEEMLTHAGDPIVRAEIQMGYRGQFPDWTKGALSFDSDDGIDTKSRLDMFYGMDAYTVQGAKEEMDSALRIDVQVLAAYPESLPPDRVIYIKGIVGAVKYGLIWQESGGSRTLTKDYFSNNDNFPETRQGEQPYSTIEKLLFFYITSRFFRNGGFEIDEGVNSEGQIEIRVLNYDSEAHEFRTDPEFLRRPKTERWSAPLVLRNGLLGVEDAVNLGVLCAVSKELIKQSNENRLPAVIASGAGMFLTAEKTPTVTMQSTAGAQISELELAFPELCWMQMMDGNFFFFSESESQLTVVDNDAVRRMTRERKDIVLPAVYEVMLSGMRFIKCPFIGFISPMQRIGFNSSFDKGTLVSYYYPHKKHMWFRAITSEVIFDTTGENNMMTIKCIDAEPPGDDAELATESQEQAKAETAAAERTIVRTLDWFKVNIGVWESWEKARFTMQPDTWTRFIQIFVLDYSDRLAGIEGLDASEWGPDKSFDARCAAGFRFLMSHEENKANNDKWFEERGLAEYADTMGAFMNENPGRLHMGDPVWIPVVHEDYAEE